MSPHRHVDLLPSFDTECGGRHDSFVDDRSPIVNRIGFHPSCGWWSTFDFVPTQFSNRPRSLSSTDHEYVTLRGLLRSGQH